MSPGEQHVVQAGDRSFPSGAADVSDGGGMNGAV